MEEDGLDVLWRMRRRSGHLSGQKKLVAGRAVGEG
jgi:hypothetical protein